MKPDSPLSVVSLQDIDSFSYIKSRLVVLIEYYPETSFGESLVDGRRQGGDPCRPTAVITTLIWWLSMTTPYSLSYYDYLSIL